MVDRIASILTSVCDLICQQTSWLIVLVNACRLMANLILITELLPPGYSPWGLNGPLLPERLGWDLLNDEIGATSGGASPWWEWMSPHNSPGESTPSRLKRVQIIAYGGTDGTVEFETERRYSVLKPLADCFWVESALKGLTPTTLPPLDWHADVGDTVKLLNMYFAASVACPGMQCDLKLFLDCPENMATKEIGNSHCSTVSLDIRAVPVEVQLFRGADRHMKVIGAHIIRFELQDGFTTLYQIEVNSLNASWMIRRDYDAFVGLYASLSTLFDDRVLPHLPDVCLIEEPSFSYLHTRQRQLDIFLQTLVNSDFFECRELYDFLKSDYSEDDRVRPVEPRHRQRFDIVLTVWRYDVPGDSRSPVIFDFDVYEYFASSLYLKWSISVEEARIKALHDAMHQRFPDDQLPDWPIDSKRNCSMSFVSQASLTKQINQRGIQLELFIKKIINCTPFQCPVLDT